MKPNALIVDADSQSVLTLSNVFREAGFSIKTADSLSAAREALLREMPEIAMIDLDISGADGLSLLENTDLSNVMEVYLMTAAPSLKSAVYGMRAGASDYFQKPVDLERLEETLRSFRDGLEARAAHEQNAAGSSGRGLLIGESTAMRKLYRLLRKVAPSDATVFLAGESGVGKELAAVTIHQLSERAAADFVAVNCGAVASEIMESELFGHEKGSFTGAHRSHRGYFERASGGTLFLDEITEMPPDLQVKLLRVLENRTVVRVGGEREKRVDLRVIAATNRDPQEAVAAGALREDLYYRLAQFPVRVPALRERGDDVILLARQFLDELNQQTGVDKDFAEDVLEVLRLYDWPGNVRELKNAVARGHILAGEQIRVDDLPGTVLSGGGSSEDYLRVSIGLSLQEVERRMILATLEHYEGDKKHTAEVLGISLKTLYTKIKKYRVQAKEKR